MSDKPDEFLDSLFSAARATPERDTSRLEYGFETRLCARLREETRTSLATWAWRLCPFFAALAIGIGCWNYTAQRTEADTQIVMEASPGDDQMLLAYMTGDRR